MTEPRTGWRFIAALVLIAAAAAAVTKAGLAQVSSAVTVIQKDIAFNPPHVEIKQGGTVTFINEDPFGHNVYSESPGGDFDLGRQQPGQKNVVTFKRSGTFVAECRIHPKMHLEIVVML